MSASARNAVEGHRDHAESIQRFLWTGRPHKSEPIARTNEEMTEFLENLRNDCWSSYNSGAHALGWTE